MFRAWGKGLLENERPNAEKKVGVWGFSGSGKLRGRKKGEVVDVEEKVGSRLGHAFTRTV